MNMHYVKFISACLLCGALSAVMFALMVILNKTAASITGFENAVWQLLAGFATVALFTVLVQRLAISLPSGTFAPVLLLGFVNTGVGCYLYFSSMQQLPAQSVAICGYLDPLSALVFPAVFLAERMSPVQMIGAALILGGAAFGEYYGRKRVPGVAVEGNL